jgi:NAD-dependent SIR2 family protein deacetylase
MCHVLRVWDATDESVQEIYPSNFVPSPCHRFVKLLEMNDQLLRNYSMSNLSLVVHVLILFVTAQNIDGLFESVGVQRMLNCHGPPSPSLPSSRTDGLI